MSRQIYRVPLTFDHPLNQVWPGYLLPERLREKPCPDCENGYSEHAEFLFRVWNGNEPFHPILTGSAKLRTGTPAVRDFAERNIANAPEYYGTGEAAILREAERVAKLWNGQWCHHLNQEDVDALLAAGRLRDLTHTWSRETGWQPIVPTPTVTAEQVNEWSISSRYGHDDMNAAVVIEARCKRDGMPYVCGTCGGEALLESYPGQRAEAEAWEPTEPPTGDGWQLWSTVNEGAPISPVFATAEELAGWMSDPARGRDWVPLDTAARFVSDGWAPSGFETAETGFVRGVEHVGFHENGGN